MKTTRKLTMAFLMVMVALLAFVGSTFAWITISNEVSTSVVQGSVVGAKGVYIRKHEASIAATANWAQQANLDGIEKPTLKPCSTMDSGFGLVTLNNDYNFGTAASGAAGQYIEFALDFLSDAKVTITPTVEITTGTTQNDLVLKSVLRVSMQIGTHTDPDGDNGFAFKSFDNEFSGSGFATLGSTAPDGFDASTLTGLYSFYDSIKNPTNGLFVSKGILAEGGAAPSTTYSSYAARTNTLLSATKTFNVDGTNGATPTNANIVTVTVRIWVDGWDTLCANYMKNGTFNLSIKFVAVDRA